MKRIGYGCAHEDTFREVMGRVLEKYQVDFFGSGPELVEAIRSGGYDMAITSNYRNPSGTGGVDSIKAIREFDKDTPILMVSGGFPDSESAREAGANEFVELPLDVNEFRETVGKYLEPPEGD